MRCSASSRSPTTARRRGTDCAQYQPQLTQRPCTTTTATQRASSHVSARVSVVAGYASAQAFYAASQSPFSSVSASELTEKLHRYALIAASSGCRPDNNDGFLAACLREFSQPHRLRRLCPRQIASLVLSLVHLGAQPGEDWLSELDACCYCHPGPFDPASSTTVLHSLALLHISASTPPPPASNVAAAFAASSFPHHNTIPSHHPNQPQPRHLHSYNPHGRSWDSTTSASSLHAATPSPSPAPTPATAFTSFRFPHAVYLRLLQGGLPKYSFEQLTTLLQAFRCLGVPMDEEAAAQVGAHMAAQLRDMAPEHRSRALGAVVGGGRVPV